MDDMWTRIGVDLVDRVSGPMKFRLVLQPLMAITYAVISGLRDARAGRPPYFWELARHSEHRRGNDSRRLAPDRQGIHPRPRFSTSSTRSIATHFVYPGEAIIVAIVLAMVPYLLLRGVVTRIARRMNAHHTAPP